MKKNDLVTLSVTGMSAEGNGVGRAENTVVFVPGAAVGDLLSVRIVKVLKNYCFGKIAEILTPSDSRQQPDCPVSSKCGGCAFCHLSYAAECAVKQQRVQDCIQRIAGLPVQVSPIIAATRIQQYRNKAQYPVGTDAQGRLIAGFYALHSHRIVQCPRCRLLPPEFDQIRDAVLAFAAKQGISAYDEAAQTGLLRHIYIRKGFVTGQIMVCLVINGKSLPGADRLAQYLLQVCGDIRTVVINHNTADTNVILGDRYTVLYGDGVITDRLAGVDVRISPGSFYQVNRDMAERLYQIAAAFACPDGKTVLDLYCGAGTIGLSMAARAKRIIGVETVKSAVKDARANAIRNGIENADFYCDTALHAAQTLGIAPDIVLLDPPRKGAGEQLVSVIAGSFQPERVVYVSCDPATLARDLKLFCQQGYVVQAVQPVDLFPRTAHVETVVLMSKTEK